MYGDETKVDLRSRSRSSAGGGERDEKDGEKEKEEEETTIMGLCKSWLENSSTNGVPQIDRSEHIVRKLFWIAIVLAGTGKITLHSNQLRLILHVNRTMANMHMIYCKTLFSRD